MDPRANPYAPGAGTKPPALTGRDDEIEAFVVLLERLRQGAAGQSMIVKGLRGVGKTVLLNTFEDFAVERDWIPIFKECEPSTSLPGLVARHCRRIIEDLKPTARATKRLRSMVARLSTFTVVDPNGFELRFDLGRGEAAPDPLSDDFVDLLLEVGALAGERGRGLVFLLDEVQFIHPNEFGPFVVGLHRINQKGLPVTCVAAGLPSLPALAGEAKSYAERLFSYPTIRAELGMNPDLSVRGEPRPEKAEGCPHPQCLNPAKCRGVKCFYPTVELRRTIDSVAYPPERSEGDGLV